MERHHQNVIIKTSSSKRHHQNVTIIKNIDDESHYLKESNAANENTVLQIWLLRVVKSVELRFIS